MRISHTLNYDEFAEAQIAHGSAAAAVYKKMRVLSNVWGLVSWLGYCALACFYSAWGGDSAHTNLFMRDIGLPTLPWVSLLGLLWVMEARKSIGGLGHPWTTRLATPLANTSGLRSWYAVVGWAFGVMIALVIAASAVNQKYNSPIDVFFNSIPLAMLPWLIYSFWVLSLQKVRQRVAIRRSWREQEQLHGEQEYQFSEEFLELHTPRITEHVAWSAFAGYLETPRLLLLYPNSATFHIIPKRVFTDPAEFDRLCGLLQSKVREGTFLARPSAFPVVAVAKAVPVRPAQENQEPAPTVEPN